MAPRTQSKWPKPHAPTLLPQRVAGPVPGSGRPTAALSIDAVAVVIEVVAELRARRRRADAAEHAPLADLRAAAADAHRRGAARVAHTRHGAVVDEPVAVVVARVAVLGARAPGGRVAAAPLAPVGGVAVEVRVARRHAPVGIVHAPATQVGRAPIVEHARPHDPQLSGSVMVLKPSSTRPLQSLSRPSHTSGPDAGAGVLAAVGGVAVEVDGARAARAHAARARDARGLGACAKTQPLPQRPQFARSLCRSKPSSTRPLQSLSRPSHTSRVPVRVQAYSQPLSAFMSRSYQPESHWRTRQVPVTHDGMLCARRQSLPQRPQLSGSVAVSKPSSTRPLQLLSRPSQTSIPEGVQVSGPLDVARAHVARRVDARGVELAVEAVRVGLAPERERHEREGGEERALHRAPPAVARAPSASAPPRARARPPRARTPSSPRERSPGRAAQDPPEPTTRSRCTGTMSGVDALPARGTRRGRAGAGHARARVVDDAPVGAHAPRGHAHVRAGVDLAARPRLDDATDLPRHARDAGARIGAASTVEARLAGAAAHVAAGRHAAPRPAASGRQNWPVAQRVVAQPLFTHAPLRQIWRPVQGFS